MDNGVRFDLECLSVRDIPEGAESSAYGATFIEGITDLINLLDKHDHLPDAGEWYKTYYYTVEDEGYYFYMESDLVYPEEEA